MPSAVSPNPRAGPAGPNAFDDAVDEFLKDLPIDNDTQNSTAAREPAKDIDEEVVVKKKRKPVPKLDENRLSSQDGIPRLRKITKSRLKFRGKGHEYSDISKLLNTYQLWLDDLYPRAKFKDALTMVEAVGHKKMMQVKRKTWLDATKPHQREDSPDRLGDVEMSGALPPDDVQDQSKAGGEEDDDAIFGESVGLQGNGNGAREETRSDVPDEEDDLDALLAESGPPQRGAAAEEPPKKSGPFEEDEDEDDLDALLAERLQTNAINSTTSATRDHPSGSHPSHSNDFADEEEVMAGMDDMW